MFLSPYFLIWPPVIPSAVSQSHTKPSSTAHPRSQHVLLLDWQLQHTKHFKLVLSVGNAWKDILSSFWQAALTISVSLCSTQVLLRIFHVRYLIRAKCVVGVLHQHSHNSWIAVGFIHTHLLHGKSVVSTSLWCRQEGWAVQQQQELSGLQSSHQLQSSFLHLELNWEQSHTQDCVYFPTCFYPQYSCINELLFPIWNQFPNTQFLSCRFPSLYPILQISPYA